ncbi:MAG: hypothetical protein MJY82_08390 [Fibrobacter sp.]|nr:hypothetical protein [Fibrobacter sp.]
MKPFCLWGGAGIIERHHMVTQVVSKGFCKKTFSYQSDLDVRFSPIAHKKDSMQWYVDGGVHFNKNFAKDLEYSYFANVGGLIKNG